VRRYLLLLDHGIEAGAKSLRFFEQPGDYSPQTLFEVLGAVVLDGLALGSPAAPLVGSGAPSIVEVDAPPLRLRAGRTEVPEVLPDETPHGCYEGWVYLGHIV
jgi:hypothetical protein